MDKNEIRRQIIQMVERKCKTDATELI